MPKVGGIGLSAKEFKEIIDEIVEEAKDARQAAWDTTMEILGEIVTGDEALDLLAMMSDEEFAAMFVDNPDALAEGLKGLRERRNNGNR
jgi:hypothetical protein